MRDDLFDVVIVGAGLSGLACAYLLAQSGNSVCVVEASHRAGGRIRSVFDNVTGRYLADLGPTWVWPQFQPLITQWINLLDIETFEQFDAGNAVIDHGPDHRPQIAHLTGQQGSVRVVGGSQALIDHLCERLPETTVITDSLVTSISTREDDGLVKITCRNKAALYGRHVIIAVSPRIAANTISFEPPLQKATAQAMNSVPTWMAGHAKTVAIYKTAFWRARGLSGRIASHEGPIVEAHDHSGPDGTPAAIFGFIGWPHDVRADMGAQLVDEIQGQLKRCFGEDSPDPVSIHLEDWSQDAQVASPADLNGPMPHPDVGPDALRQPVAGGRVIFAGAETATRSPGLIEGAFDAALRAAHQVKQAMDGSGP